MFQVGVMRVHNLCNGGVTGVVAAVCLRAVPALRGALRACNFWRRAFPFFLRYKWAEWRINSEEKTPEARECRWDLLHDYYAPILLRHILELRGYFIKVGQFASSVSLALRPLISEVMSCDGFCL